MGTSEVQFKQIPGSWSGSFTSDVGDGNTVFFFGWQYSTAGATMGSSSPEFNGSAVSGALKLFEEQSPGTDCVYGTIWMLPNLGGGAANVSLTNSGGTVDSNVGSAILEVAGLGASPAIDSGASPNPETDSGTSAAPATGSTGDITSAEDIILAMAIIFGFVITAPGSPWTAVQNTSGFDVAAYQIPGSPGASYGLTTSADGTAAWSGGIVAVGPGGGTPHTDTAALTVTPVFSATAAKGGAAHTATAALTVTPSFSAARTLGHSRTAALTVRPSFSAEPSGGTRPLPGGMFGVTGAYDPPRRRPWKGGSW